MARNSPIDPPPPVEQLATLAERHDSKVRLLFHLRNYISLVYYDPVVAKKDRTAEFRRFVSANNFDLWNELQKRTESRKASKRVQQTRREVEACQVTAAKQKKAPAKPRAKPPPPRPKRPAQKDPEPTSEGLVIDSDLGWPTDSFPPRKRARTQQIITHPLHHVKPTFNGNLGAFLSSYRTLTDDNEPLPADQWDKRAAADAEVYARVARARQSGRLAELEAHGVGTSQQLPKFNNPVHEPSHFDNLVAHAVHYSKLRSNLRKFHQSIVKRNSQSIEQYYRRLAGAEDREKKELERQLRQIARRTSQEVMKKWKLAEKIVEQRRQAQLAEEHREKGKEYLNHILENSAKLIESRMGDLDKGNDDDEDHTDTNDAHNNDSGSEESDENDSESDDSEPSTDLSDSDIPNGDADDADLTLEQLREKYKNLPELESSSESESGSDEAENDINASELDHSDSADEKPSEEALRIYSEVKGDSDEESLLEDEDDASNAEDGTESAEGESESESESESEDERPGLAALLGPMVDEDSHESDSNEDNTNAEDQPAEMAEVNHTDDVDQKPLSESNENEPEKSLNGHSVSNLGSSSVTDKLESNEDGDDDDKEAAMEVDSVEEDSKNADSPSSPSKSPGDRNGHALTHRIEPPFLLKGTLREYQRNGLDWMAGLVQSGTNGILADEMGLGKTIQTIALLLWLACEKQIWGPHLIVVPTSVMLNWEMEFKRFAPGLKILTYFGTPQQRKRKRRGWNKEDTWHVCITSYQLVIQDQVVFRSKRWQFMVLDEAHNIKNFRSQRWQALLNFNAQHRLLLTGTPLQNNLVELWSLLYFLMPSTRATQMMPDGFASLDDFQEWFARPVDKMVEEGDEADDEARATITKLHNILRPYLLRRLKVDVEKQMPGKYEHVVYCRLSKRQRYLYDDFMSRASTRDTLASGNFMSILNCLMQLRKVCNHPDLFEVRPIVTSFVMDQSVSGVYGRTIAPKFAIKDKMSNIDLDLLNLVFPAMEDEPKWAALTRQQTRANKEMALRLAEEAPETVYCEPDFENAENWAKYAVYSRRLRRAEQRQHALYLNMFRTKRVPIFGRDLLELARVFKGPIMGVLSASEREQAMIPILERFGCITPAVVSLDQPSLVLGEVSSRVYGSEFAEVRSSPLFHEAQVRLSIAFPDKRLLQYDCGKLQRLSLLLRDLISKGHRCLIFTQMTRVLDVLEQFLNLHGWRYLRLDGATRIEQRQALTERFNKDPSIPVFILSTRSGGLGINLTGADTVIFYDSDWNPAMDRQCQDRCHRIGQTRDVHIYRLVSEFTIESNILRKATQKTILDNVVIQEGDFTTEYFSRLSVHDILGNDAGRGTQSQTLEELQVSETKNLEAALAQAEDRDDQLAANQAMSEARMDLEEFAEPSASGVDTSREGSQAPQQQTSAVGTENASEVAHSREAPEAAGQDWIEPGEKVSEVQEEEMAEDPEIGHIDDWMIKAIESGYIY